MATIAGAKITSSNTIVREQIRGSSLLVLGKVLSVGITSLSQILIVRHLTTSEYGSFAYALAVVVLWQSLSNFGLHEAIARFFPIYHHHGDYPRLFGTVFLSLGMICLTGGAVITIFFVRPELVLRFVHEPSRSLDCLFILIFLVPLESLDALLMGLFASLSSARAIFYRRHVVAPGLKLVVVLAMLLLHRGAIFLAGGFLLASVTGILWYGWILIREFRSQELLSEFQFSELCFPLREIFSFTVPMMTSDIVAILNQSVVVMILSYYFGLREVAMFRVVVPAAAVNGMIAVTSALLYLPAASKLFASGDRQGLHNLYWRTAAWVAVLSFPSFVLTFCFARPLMIFLYGARYADTGVLLAILSVGYYLDTIFGFNGLTLKAADRMGSIVACNVGAAIVTVLVSFMLIPHYGALGAAIAVAASLSVLGVLKQFAMARTIGISFGRNFASLYSLLAAGIATLLLVRVLASRHLPWGLLLATSIVAAVFAAARKELRISESFPELARLPILRRLIA